MNRSTILPLVIISALYASSSFGAAGAAYVRYPKSSPLFNCALAINAETGGGIRWDHNKQLKEFGVASDVDSKYIKTSNMSVRINLTGLNWESRDRTAHIGIGVPAMDWGVTAEEAYAMPDEDMKFVHKTIKGLIEKHGVTAIDSMAGKSIGGTILSHLVCKFRSYYQKFEPVIVTLHTEYPVKATGQIHLVLAEYLDKPEFGRCKEVYTRIREGSYCGKVLFHGLLSREDQKVLHRLLITDSWELSWDRI